MESHKAKIGFDLFHTPEAIDLTTEILDLKENSLYLKGRRKKIHIFVNNICRDSLYVFSNRSRAK